MPVKRDRPVPSLRDLCISNVGNNLGAIAKYFQFYEEGKGCDPLVQSPFDMLRNFYIINSLIISVF